jgi:hypothetical protein
MQRIIRLQIVITVSIVTLVAAVALMWLLLFDSDSQPTSRVPAEIYPPLPPNFGLLTTYPRPLSKEDLTLADIENPHKEAIIGGKELHFSTLDSKETVREYYEGILVKDSWQVIEGSRSTPGQKPSESELCIDGYHYAGVQQEYLASYIFSLCTFYGRTGSQSEVIQDSPLDVRVEITKDLPIYPGVSDVTRFRDARHGHQYYVNYSAPATAEDITAFYNELLRKEGFVVYETRFFEDFLAPNYREVNSPTTFLHFGVPGWPAFDEDGVRRRSFGIFPGFFIRITPANSQEAEVQLILGEYEPTKRE